MKKKYFSPYAKSIILGTEYQIMVPSNQIPQGPDNGQTETRQQETESLWNNWGE